MQENPAGRPKKYASAAERAAAYRERYAVISVRLRIEQAARIDEIALARNESRADLLQQLISFALANDDWRTRPRFAKSIVQAPQTRRRETKFTKAPHYPDEKDLT